MAVGVVGERPSLFLIERNIMSIKIYFGVMGSGKTTKLAHIAKKEMKKGNTVVSNVPIKGTYELSVLDDIGKVQIENCVMLIDEAGIEYNNREVLDRGKKEKAMNQAAIKFYKLSRHYKVKDIIIVSQSYDDMDITLRRLADEYHICKRSLIPTLFYTYQIKKKIGVDEQTKQIIDEYYKVPFSRRYYWGKPLFSMFNSYECPQLPAKEWNKW